MTVKIFASLCVLAALSACMTPEQREQQRLAQEQQDIETCRSYGLRPGSEAFGNCRLQIDLARQQAYYDRSYYYGGYGHYGPRFGSGIYYMGR